MKILVTGGAAYIGSVVTEELLKASHTMVVFDNLSQGHRAAVHPDAAFIPGDLRDVEAIERVFATYPERIVGSAWEWHRRHPNVAHITIRREAIVPWRRYLAE